MQRPWIEPHVPRAAGAGAHATKIQKRGVELLRSAYVKFRHSKHYKISDEELAWVTERVGILPEIVPEAAEARLSELRLHAGTKAN